ncbi:hypothetical protein [Curtobacterium sp. BRB10]|uniref:hypothetical protein n=1 Tax=Curtobacterium sp. BRB10 TaxID=2962579 RepID=UPI0028818CE4|nr:hypothetical protein [Curtobacterium sp. BRB10]MDT0232742.1 hypothetical protein [Curtobacterium sp. BRB10]
MTNTPRRSDHRGAAVLLVVLVVVAWAASVALPLYAWSLMLRVDAPEERAVPIVLAWFVTPFIAAVGLTVGLVVLQRARRGARTGRSSGALEPDARTGRSSGA